MNADGWIARFREVRGHTERLAAPLTPEDQQLQASPASSPTKWHRGHTTWFFETFLLGPRGQAPFEPAWGPLFNSYYEAVGPRHARPERGLLSRPSCDEIAAWRRIVDGRVEAWLAAADAAALADAAPILALGLAHEEQHQELILTDVLAAFAKNPLVPAIAPPASFAAEAPGWVEHPGGLVAIGHDGDGFAFDNEGPRHDVALRPFRVSRRLVTVGEWLSFIADGGYTTPSLWLSDGIAWVRDHGIDAPGYARVEGGALVVRDLSGEHAWPAHAPVSFVSAYEADAFATWAGARLPTEAEWEAAAPGLAQVGSAGWQWTRSAYSPYPGFRAPPGAVGEYNGKFMINQLVLRGASRFTPPGHSRATYRNFWPPETRFQATTVRLAADG